MTINLKLLLKDFPAIMFWVSKWLTMWPMEQCMLQLRIDVCVSATGRVLKNERHVRGAGLSSKQTWKMTSDQRTMGKTPSSATMKSKKGIETRSSPWPVASIANISIKRIFKMFKNMILYLTSCVGGFGRVEMEPRKEIRKGCRSLFHFYSFFKAISFLEFLYLAYKGRSTLCMCFVFLWVHVC